MRWLLLCAPIGLLMMWSDRCHWNRAVKSVVSLCFIVVVLLLTLPQTRAPGQGHGGVQIVSAEAAVDRVGPTMRPDAQRYEVYTPKYVPKNSVIAEPKPTLEPYFVYCNDGGAKYHLKKCVYVKGTTPKVPLTQAVDAGFKRCKDCGSPKIEDVYSWEDLMT